MSKRSKFWLCLALVLCLVGGLVAGLVQTSFGQVTITDVVIETDSGRFTGTNQLNQAFMDRFTILKAEYPAPDAEKALLASRFPALPEPIRDGMVDIANKVRGVFSGGRQIGFGKQGVDVVISTRTLLRWCELSLCYQGLASSGISPVLYALDRAVGFRAGREGHAMLLELCQRVFGTSTNNSQPDKD